jgi:fatty-acyl-CoA synthase
MKLCFSTLVCPLWSLDQIIAASTSMGLGGVDFRGVGDEIDITRLPEFNEKIDETVAMMRASELAMPCLNTSITLVAPADRWQQMLDEANRCANLAMKTKTPYLRIFGGGIPKEMSRDEARSMAQRRIRQLVKICHGKGCRPILETHDDWTNSRQVLELIHEFSPEEMGVLWDIEHTVRGGEVPVDTATQLRRYIVHVHVKDSIRGENKNIQKLLGEGDIPLGDAVRSLKELGYEGWYSLETEKRWHPDAPEPEVSLPHFVRYMNRLGNPNDETRITNE